METLKVHRLGEAPLKFQSFTFRGGEPHIQFDPICVEKKSIWVEAHLGLPRDFMTLLALLGAIRRAHPRRLGLFIPYFPGGRQDHPEPGTPFTLQVYAKALEHYRLDAMLVADPHSPVTPALTGCDCLTPTQILNFGLHTGYNGVICPDAGAEKRAWAVAQSFQVPLIMARKVRNQATGALSHFQADPLPDTGRYLVVDDICDGGATFTGLAKVIRTQAAGVASILDLYVTHGIFSKGFEDLASQYEQIITTDSFPAIHSMDDAKYLGGTVKTVPLFPLATAYMDRRLS